ncbi:MAG: S9 family peptidase [Armatimonadetes bacterium]|nr:S9 family peptidase [Armatimonadota bacterium]
MAKRLITPEDLLKFVFVGDPQISPDGEQILFSRKQITEKNTYLNHLWSVDLKGGLKQWTQGESSAGGGRWSPDGKKILFVSDRKKPGAQFYTIDASGGEAAQLSKLPEGRIGEYQWSPDGKWIAFMFRPAAESNTEAARKERETKGSSVPPRVTESVWYRFDGDGYFLAERFSVHLLDVATGEHRQLYAGCSEVDFYDFSWAPSSTELVIRHPAEKRPLFQPANDQLFRVDLKGNVTKVNGVPKGVKSSPRWSPDGKWIAFACDPNADTWPDGNYQLFIVPADGGIAESLSAKTDFCLAGGTTADTQEASSSPIVIWAPDSQSIYTSIGWHGATHVWQFDIKGGHKQLTSGARNYILGNMAQGKLALVTADGTTLGEVACFDLASGKDQKLTAFNKEFHDSVKVSEPEEMWLEAEDGWKVQAWVMKPAEFDASKKYPAVLEIHGGPQAQYGWTFFHEFQVLAAAGYVVVFSNPRGSKGYGEAHCKAIHASWGDRDWADMQAVIKWMQSQPYINKAQMGVMGGSYGGYMTNWIVSHCKDFKAAIADRCVSNLVSLGGTCDMPLVKESFWGAYPFGDLSKIEKLWKQSPIAYFDKVDTPMLIIHSEGDLRCNIEQSEQVFYALKAQNVEARFVRYPLNSYHGLSRSGPPDLRLHRLHEILNWWKSHL